MRRRPISVGSTVGQYSLIIEGLIVALLAVVAFALSVYVHSRMTQIHRALPSEALEQQRDISNLMMDLSNVVREAQIARTNPNHHLGAVQVVLDVANDRLQSVRRNYSFAGLDGTSAALSVATPALQDVERWLESGLPGSVTSDATVASFVERRATEAFADVQQLFESANSTAVSLLETESVHISQLRDAIVLFLTMIPGLAFGLIFLLWRKRTAVHRLRRSEGHFRGIFDDGAASVALLTTDGRFRRVNRAFRDFLGYDESELTGMSFVQVIHPDDQESCCDRLFDVSETSGSPQPLEKRYRHKNGSTLWGLISISVLRHMDGRPRRLIVQVQDITAEKRAQTELKDREEQYRRIFEATTDGLCIFTDTRKLVDVNPAICNLYGRSRADMLALNPEAFFHADSHDVFETLVDAIAASQPFHDELKGLRASGTVFDAEVSGAPYFMHGELHFLASVRDVTERNQVEQVLETTAREFEHFAYAAAHDLKAPLRALRGFSDLLMENYASKLDETGLEFLGFIHDGAARMDAVINSLLEYSRVGRDGVEFEVVDLSDVFCEILQVLGRDLKECGASVHIESQLPTIEGSRSMLEEVFQNILANAIKFQAEGTKPVVHVTSQVDSYGVLLAIADNGIGIDASHRDAVFDIFRRLHPSGRYAGTGIGLAIVKKGVDLHGGSIWIDANPGGGTTVNVRLPISQWQAKSDGLPTVDVSQSQLAAVAVTQRTTCSV